MLTRIRVFVMLLITVLAAGSALAVHAQEATPEATPEPFIRLNLNTATAEELLTIPDMNNRMVREYMEYRPYVSVLQFREEIGKYVGDEQVTAWEPYVYVPVQIDEADVETLKQIPGVDDMIAEVLIAARPYETDAAFLAKLAEYLTPEQVTFAQNFLEGYLPVEATPEATSEPFIRLNLNTATAEELLTIPDMNNRMVREYMEYRPYVSVLQFREEIGKYVGDEQVTAWEPYVYVPVQIDGADVETLKQIPGVDDMIAEVLIAARPYETDAAFLAKLAEYLTPEQVTFAQNFLETPAS